MRRISLFALLVAALVPLGGGELGAQRPEPPRPPRPVTPPVPPDALPAQRGWLGISFNFVVEQRDEQRREWAVVGDVYPESPAARAGVERGDTIVQLNGRSDVQQLLREWRLDPGDEVRVRVRRGGSRDRDLRVVAAERPATLAGEPIWRGAPLRRGERFQVRPGPRVVIIDGDTIRIPVEEMAARADSMAQRMRMLLVDSLGPRLRELEREIPQFRMRMDRDTIFFERGRPGEVFTFDFDVGRRAVAGAEFTELNPELAEYFRGAREGVLVLRVAAETPAARSGLEPGDVVVRANGEAVRSVGDLRRAINRAERREVRLDVVRRGAQREVRLRWER